MNRYRDANYPCIRCTKAVSSRGAYDPCSICEEIKQYEEDKQKAVQVVRTSNEA